MISCDWLPCEACIEHDCSSVCVWVGVIKNMCINMTCFDKAHVGIISILFVSEFNMIVSLCRTEVRPVGPQTRSQTAYMRTNGRSHLVTMSVPPHMVTRSSRGPPPTSAPPPPMMVSVPAGMHYPPGSIPGLKTVPPAVSIGSRGHPIPVFQA